MIDQEMLSKWLLTRPADIQKLAAEFPMGSKVTLPGEEPLWVIGYNEGDALILSRLDPHSKCNYESMVGQRRYLCAEHLRGDDVRVTKHGTPT